MLNFSLLSSALQSNCLDVQLKTWWGEEQKQEQGKKGSGEKISSVIIFPKHILCCHIFKIYTGNFYSKYSLLVK